MDWSKAKTILIVSFILVNIILGYNLFLVNSDANNAVNELFEEDVVALLANKNIRLDTEIPKDTEDIPTLLVEYENISMGNIKKRFFGDNGQIINTSEGLSVIEKEDEKLTVLNGKLLIYESKKIEEQDIQNAEMAKELGLKFLIKRGYDISDLKLSHNKMVDDEHYLEFSKIYNNRHLEFAFTNLHINNTGVKKMERLWINVIEEAKSPIGISNAHKSILELLSMNRAYDKTITDISLSYYFDPERHEYIENPERAKQGRAIPAWRIQFEDGYKIFLDNY